MTGIIGSDSPVYGDYSNLPEKFQPAIRAGIPFFELRTERPIMFARQINGPFSVAVSEEYDSIRQRMGHAVTWQTGDYARVRFEVENSKTGLAKAFMPDDPYWHNRIMIANNNDLRLIHAYHTKDGMFPGSLLQQEIDILYRAITIETQEWVVVSAVGRIIGSFTSKEEAQKDVAYNKYKNHEIRQRTIRVNSPETEQMIIDWRRVHKSRFGWSDCPAFKVVQEHVREEIKSMRAGNQPAVAMNLTPDQFDAALVAAIRRMPMEKRKELLLDTTKKQVNEKVFDGKQPWRIPIQKLRSEAKRLGLKTPRKIDRPGLIAALREAGSAMVDAEITTDTPAPQPTPVEQEVVT